MLTDARSIPMASGSVLSTQHATAIALVLVAFGIRCIGIEHRPLDYDELYHVLAGRSWAAGHGTSIAAGSYERVRLFTEAVGLSIRWFGPTLLAARLPSLLAGAVAVWLLYRWLAQVANGRLALIGAAMLCVSQPAIALSQVARFYSWHVPAILLVATQAYALRLAWPRATRVHRALWLALIVAVLGFAFYLQPTTAIAALAIVLALLACEVPRIGGGARMPWVEFAALALLFAGSFAVPLGRTALGAAWASYRDAAPWAQEGAGRPTFYYSILAGSYGWLLHLFPFALLLAWRAAWRPALFCGVLLGVALLLHSFAGMKAERYISYLEPFFFAVWAMALNALVPLVARLWSEVASAWPQRAAARLGMVFAIAAGAFALLGVPAFRATAEQVLRVARGAALKVGPDLPENEDVDWTPYVPGLRRVTAGRMLVTADDLRALYYLGGYDLLLNRTVMLDRTQQDFGIDPRTGGRGIMTAQSLARVMRCYPRGAILVSNRRWRSQDVTDDTADFIERHAHRIPMPEASHLNLFTWRTTDASTTPACAALRRQLEARRQQTEARLVTLD